MYGFKLPEDFLIGTANSAFQSEGAWDRDGKSESMMDYYARTYAGVQSPGKEGTEAAPNAEELPDRGCFFYDDYEAYIDDMKKTGQNVYRMSIAWPRIIPTGYGEVNQKGIDFYNKVIDKLLSCGITPFVDLYHWDLPQCLMEEGGFENPKFPEWFEAYAKVCFEAFGDRVKLWSTFNELQIFVNAGFSSGTFPPFGRSSVNARLCGHHCLLAHFRAVRLYRSLALGGQIGSACCCTGVTPKNMTEEDLNAVGIQLEYQLGWWITPMLEGKYPEKLLQECPKFVEGLPETWQEDFQKWFSPIDFVGLNYYITKATEFDPTRNLRSKPMNSFYSAPGQRFASYPPGLFDVLVYISQRYSNIPIYITENGCAIPNIYDRETECDDPERIAYIREHLRMVVRAQRVGCNVKGYFYWNDADSYEEMDGYHLRFGLTWVDHETGQRQWKKSRYYFSQICKSRMVD